MLPFLKKRAFYKVCLFNLLSALFFLPGSAFAGEIPLYQSNFDKDLKLEGSVLSGNQSLWDEWGTECLNPDGTLTWGDYAACSARVKNLSVPPAANESGFLRVTSASTNARGGDKVYRARAGWQAYFKNLVIPANAVEVRLSFLYRSGYTAGTGSLQNLTGNTDLQVYVNDLAANSLPVANELVFNDQFSTQKTLSGSSWERKTVTFDPKTLPFVKKETTYRFVFSPVFFWDKISPTDSGTSSVELDDVSLVAITPDSDQPKPPVVTPDPIVPPVVQPRTPTPPESVSRALGASQCRIISVDAGKRSQSFSGGTAKVVVSGGNPATPDRRFAAKVVTTKKGLLKKTSFALDGKTLNAQAGKLTITPAMLGSKDQAVLLATLQPAKGQAKKVKLGLRFKPCKRIGLLAKKGKNIRAAVITRTPIKSVNMAFAKAIQFRATKTQTTVGFVSLDGENGQRFPILRDQSGNLKTAAPVNFANNAKQGNLRFTDFQSPAFSVTVEFLSSALAPQARASNQLSGTFTVVDADGQENIVLKRKKN